MTIVDQIRGTAASANITSVINPRSNDVAKEPLPSSRPLLTSVQDSQRLTVLANAVLREAFVT